MKMYVIVAVVASLLMPATLLSSLESPDNTEPTGQTSTSMTMEIVPNLLIIKFRDAMTFAPGSKTFGIGSLDAVLQRIGASEIAPFNTMTDQALRKKPRPALHSDRMVKVFYTADDRPELLAREISADPSVEYAEPYYSFPLNYTPNDPRLNQQWAVTVMNLREAWDITTGDSTIVIGNVDTGVDWSHEDLALNIWINPGEWGVNGELSNNGIDDDGNGKIDDWRGWDFIGAGTAQNRMPNNNPMDGTLGHGTMTSGCSTARTDNGIGIAGSGFQGKILAIKASGDNSSGVAAGYEGILYAVQMGAKIVNCSWGGTGPFSQALQDIVNDANAMGVLVISSSGNNPLDNDYIPHWPSSLNYVLNVGSVQSSGAASNWCTYGTTVHTYAPGSGILTTRKGGGYTSPTGTSFSAPLTAGVAALVWSVNPDWTPTQVAMQLRVTSDQFGALPQSKRYGRLNAFRAVSENRTLSDIPGVRLKNTTLSFLEGGNRFTEPGQTARVTMELENVLAQTSENAVVTLAIDDASLLADAASWPLDNMGTFDTRTVEFDVRLADIPTTSEGYLPVRLRIQDGEYIDYVAARIPIYLIDAWHTSLNFGNPYFTSINTATSTAAWATANVSSQDLVLRTVNAGASWTNAGSSGYPSGKGVYCIFALSSTNALVGTGPSNGAAEIFRTTNGGSTWTGVSVSELTPFVNWIHMFDAENGLFQGDPLNGRWGIATTMDGGATWQPIENTLFAPAGEAGWNNSYSRVGDTLWFGTNNSRIYRSTDRGETWHSLSTPSKHSVNISFADALRGVARFTAQQNQGGEEMLAVTSDGGETWTPLTNVQMQSGGAVQFEPNGKRLWLIQGSNARVSEDMGQSWYSQAVPGAFGTITTSTVFSNSIITDVYAGGLNIFKYRSNHLADVTVAVNRSPSEHGFRIDHLYPNPLSATSAGGSVLGFTTEYTTDVKVQIFDNLGRLLVTALDARLAGGTHTYRLSSAGLSPGSYHVRVTAGDRMLSRTLLVIH